MPEELNVGLVGCGFMGKAHSNAWLNTGKFFNLPIQPGMKAICALPEDEDALRRMAENWGWEGYVTDYKELVTREDIDLVDVATPNNTHAEISIAAAEAGKNVSCEKPLAMNVAEAKEMLQAVKEAGVRHMVWFNYRRVPAVALARRLIDEGRIGKIYHFRAQYLQDWIMDPEFPLVWRLRKEVGGSGAHGDLNAHITDLARYLVGEIDEVVGMSETFIKERPLEAEAVGLTATAGEKRGQVTVDDTVLFLARFENGAVGSFEGTRFGAGRKNGERFEINGEKGTLAFDFERMNELEFFSREDPEGLQGFKTILATEPGHPYMEAYWPPGHLIGYEHTFVSQAADLVKGIAEGTELKPDFEDGLRNQEVLDAVLKSCEERAWIKVGE
ncbi:MAG: dehydrogenase [Planctomycetes bacterium DG_23]|nr:MAG: dehydrogenase [Planctomycetes bacterium DG_23]